MPRGIYPRTPAMSAAVSFGRTGVRRTPKQRAARKKKTTRAWFKRNPKKLKAYDEKYLERRARNNAKRRRNLRLAAIKKLGGRCVSNKCRWVNADGSKGCTDIRVLQFDHVFGGGTKERNKAHVERVWKNVLEDEEGLYQLLCSNCNWIKAHENKEFVLKYAYAGVSR